ncbi:MAG: xanthine dehydrogenase accessory factor [Cellvibrionaceae bacterium]|jgi:xanthine dehydrogenase accessory factor
MFDEFFSKAHELTNKGEPFVTATVVRAEKPTSGKPGDKAIITIDGVMHGWIGGSCASPTVVKEALKALTDDESRLIRLSTDPKTQTPREGLTDLPMTCFSGGTLEIYIEPVRPKPRLMIIGNLPVAQALCHLGHAMNYHVIAVDPDTKGASMPLAHEVVTDLDKIEKCISPTTYVVVATHGNFDEVALEKAIKGNAPYIGLVSSMRRATSVRDYLKMAGYGKNDLLALKAPAGLDIQARRGDEIALSIMAEIVERRRTAENLDLTLMRQQYEVEVLAPEIAIDPICQMEVVIETAKHTHEFKGQLFYFCCPACKRTFAKNPESYLKPVV